LQFTDPFDCQSDPCHLAWLIRDHSELLLSLVRGATCSNGTRFEELDPSAFNGCPVSILFVCLFGAFDLIIEIPLMFVIDLSFFISRVDTIQSCLCALSVTTASTLILLRARGIISASPASVILS